MSQAQPMEPARYPLVITTVRLSPAAWKWLREQALDEAEANGGSRPNASVIIERLIRKAAGSV